MFKFIKKLVLKGLIKDVIKLLPDTKDKLSFLLQSKGDMVLNEAESAVRRVLVDLSKKS